MRHGQRLVLGAALGDCVHVAGLLGFLRLAEQTGYRTRFLGPAVPVDRLLEAVEQEQPDLVAVSYRLGPVAATQLLRQLEEEVKARRIAARFVFGGTPEVAEVARRIPLFDAVFSGKEPLEEIVAFLRGETAEALELRHADTLVERIAQQYPHPLIRHHFGLPTVEDTVKGAEQIARAQVLDVLSLGPDQNAQECFFRPEEQDPSQDGAGGVPIRKPEDLQRIWAATRCGNYPLVRCYSGTRDLIRMAEVLVRTIHNAWCAVPLFWYNVLDARSTRPLREAISENQACMAWHARHGIPVEVNESHHWSLRDAPDSVAVAAAFLAAYNAKKQGVRHYVAQFMFNTPPGTSVAMDLAKMLAKIDLIEQLVDSEFTVFRQVRAGLASFPADMHLAKGHLGSTTLVGMMLKPHILHVVGYCEGDHAARPEDVIESCLIARGAIRHALLGLPDMVSIPEIARRRDQLKRDALLILQTIKQLAPNGVEDPWTDPETLARAVESGLLDAPHLKGNPHACGRVVTRMVDGMCVAVDEETGMPLSEEQRIARLDLGSHTGRRR